jgi:peptidoglycan-associated lipoprotein
MLNMRTYGRCLIAVLLLSFLLAPSYSFAQKKKKDKAPKEKKSKAKGGDMEKWKKDIHVITGDKHFALSEYTPAIVNYEKAILNNSENLYAIYQAAECHRRLRDINQAQKYYKVIIDNNSAAFPLSRFWYAIQLRDNGNYTMAKKQFEAFLTEYKGQGLEAEEFKEEAKSGIKGCQFAMDELQKPVRDYKFTNMPDPINTIYSDYSPALGLNDSMIIFASDRRESGGTMVSTQTGANATDMYAYQFNGNEWEKIDIMKMMPKINSNFPDLPGCFAKGYTKFYFTRCDLVTSKGEAKFINCGIYVANKKSDSTWTEPILLNENINPKGEWNAYPSVSPDGLIMFFASRRTGGFGDSDIWYSTSTGKEDWGPAVNAGNKVNTFFNDRNPNYYAKEGILFFSSNGHAGFGGLDIHMARETEGFETVTNIGLPFNTSKDDFFFVLTEKHGYLASDRPNGKGNDDIYSFEMESVETLIAIIEKDSVALAQSISVSGVVVDQNNKPVTNAQIALTDSNKTQLKTTTTNEKGEFRFDNLSSAQSYRVVLIEKNARLTQRIEYSVGDLKLTSSEVAPSRKLFENIYFDFNQSELRPEAKKTLDDLALFIKENPKVQVELNANTDSIGSEAYNKELSRKRGQVALNYLKSKGVDNSAIVINAMGKGAPITSNNNQIGRQLNRRVEFFVLGGSSYETQTMTYVIEPNENLRLIAERYEMTVEELKTINDLDSDQLIPYTPLRVRRTVYDHDIIAQATMEHSLKYGKKLGKKQYVSITKSNQTLDQQYSIRNEKVTQENLTIAERNKIRMQNYEQKVEAKVKLQPGEDFYIVRPSNTLYSIARLYGMKGEKELMQLNGLASDTIQINQVLIVKTGTRALEPNEYLVQKGDTLESLAKRFETTVAQLESLNKLKGYDLRRNMIIRIK